MYSELFPQIGENNNLVILSDNYYKKFLEFAHQNDSKQARIYANKIFNLGRDNNYNPAIIMGHLTLSTQESILYQHHQAIEHVQIALKLSETMNSNIISHEVYLHLGMCYGKAGDLGKSLQYSLKSLEYKSDDPNILNNIGIIYFAQKQYKQSLDYYKKALSYYVLANDLQSQAHILKNIGLVYFELNNDKDTLSAYTESLEISLNIKSKKDISSIYYCMAQLYLKQKNLKKTEEILNESLTIAKENHYQADESNCYKTFSSLFEEKNDFEKALFYEKMYNNMLEMRTAQETKEKISKIETRLEIEKKEQEEKHLHLLRTKHEIEKKFYNLQTAYAEVTGINKFGVFSEKMQNVVKMAELLHADRSVPVLIEGETGTGKEIVARIIHFGKSGNLSPFIVVNCAAISPALFESELFGYEEGAFTGSKKDGMIGKFEMAQGGTLFLDEIGELPLDLQPKLLRVLQQKEIYRIGGGESIKLDVRVICATNRDLKIEMEEKRFRNDLYYRLNTGRILIPNLKERKEEIEPLAQMFLVSFAKLKKRDFQYISKSAIDLLEQYSWPGNVRELENAMERVTLLYNDIELKSSHLNFMELGKDNIIPSNTDTYLIDLPEEGFNFSHVKKNLFSFIVNKFDGNKTKAAKYMQINRNTVNNVLQ